MTESFEDENGYVADAHVTEGGAVIVGNRVYTPETAAALGTWLLKSATQVRGEDFEAPIEKVPLDDIRRDSLDALYDRVTALHVALKVTSVQAEQRVKEAQVRADDAEHVLLLITGTAKRAVGAHARKYGEEWSV